MQDFQIYLAGGMGKFGKDEFDKVSPHTRDFSHELGDTI